MYRMFIYLYCRWIRIRYTKSVLFARNQPPKQQHCYRPALAIVDVMLKLRIKPEVKHEKEKLQEEEQTEQPEQESEILWCDFKEKYKNFDGIKSCSVSVSVTDWPYSKAAHLEPDSSSTITETDSFSAAVPLSTEIRELRRDLSALRRESTWLLNVIISVLGVVAFVFIILSSLSIKLEFKLVISMLVGVIIFFIEVILFIIKSNV